MKTRRQHVRRMKREREKDEEEKKERNCHTPAAKLGKYLWFCGLPVRFLQTTR